MGWLEDTARGRSGGDGRGDWAGGARARVWGVAALVQAVSDTLSARYGTVRVQGELSGVTVAASGHAYFTLKDETGQASLRCAMFRRAFSQVDFRPMDGQRVELQGKVSVFEARGELQLVVEAMQRAGEGALYEQFLRLKARLEAEGLFDPTRKRPLPGMPRRVGVVTSLAAAALHDVLTALHRRAPHVEVLVVPCSVQGAEAPAQIVQALGQAQAWRGAGGQGLDTVLLCRGGGSLEDLWAFNDERVVRAVAACAVPLVCGVGHETDVTLADLAADVRAPTPTAAAELASLPRADQLDQLDDLAMSLGEAVHRRLEQHQQRLDRLGMRLSRPASLVQGARQQLWALEARLRQVLPQRVATQRHRLSMVAQRLPMAAQGPLRQAERALTLQASRLSLLDPQRTLERGYAWVADAQGRAITQAAAVRHGQALDVHLADGRVQAEVTQVALRTAPGASPVPDKTTDSAG
ncbi:MAG: exodeoxyribonuclease large subunit [Pseudomonadota bacterium]